MIMKTAGASQALHYDINIRSQSRKITLKKLKGLSNLKLQNHSLHTLLFFFYPFIISLQAQFNLWLGHHAYSLLRHFFLLLSCGVTITRPGVHAKQTLPQCRNLPN